MIAAQCIRCAASMPAETGPPIRFPNDVDLYPSGAISSGTGASYCPECAGTLRVCRYCGCTDEAGCEERCHWVEKDVCSRCAGKIRDRPMPETNRREVLELLEAVLKERPYVVILRREHEGEVLIRPAEGASQPPRLRCRGGMCQYFPPIPWLRRKTKRGADGG